MDEPPVAHRFVRPHTVFTVFHDGLSSMKCLSARCQRSFRGSDLTGQEGRDVLGTSLPRLNYAGKCLPRVSAANGIRSSPSAKAIEVMATGVPSDPKWRTPAPTRKVIPAPPNRANEVENAKALARHSVGYCSGSQRVYTAKLAPPNPRKKRQTKNHGRATAPR